MNVTRTAIEGVLILEPKLLGDSRGSAHDVALDIRRDSADFLYKTTDCCTPQAEGCVLWSDLALAIAWPDTGSTPRLVAKDAATPPLSKAILP